MDKINVFLERKNHYIYTSCEISHECNLLHTSVDEFGNDDILHGVHNYKSCMRLMLDFCIVSAFSEVFMKPYGNFMQFL